MFKTNKSKFLVISIITLVTLVGLSPLIFNYDNFFGIRRITDQTIDDDVNVHVSLILEIEAGVAILGYFTYYVAFDLSSNASVTAVEVERINYEIYLNTRRVDYYNGAYDPSIRVIRSTILEFEDNMTLQGSIDINYQLNSNPTNKTVFYNLIYTNNVRGEEFQGYILLKYTVFWSYILSFIILPLVLYFIIHPDFRQPSKEEKKEFDEFFDKVREINQEKRNETSPKS